LASVIALKQKAIDEENFMEAKKLKQRAEELEIYIKKLET